MSLFKMLLKTVSQKSILFHRIHYKTKARADFSKVKPRFCHNQLARNTNKFFFEGPDLLWYV